ncbi:MAG: AraC family transcriptional regulator [Coriobacteriales bacterium]|jgi:AraC-like DNA-binding protein|nr:AraC family transcriptional regulator [Coriobacteriales bacterium]
MAETTRYVYRLGDHIVEMHKEEGSLAFKLLPLGTEESSFMYIYRVIPGVSAAFYEYNSSYCHVFNDMAIARDIIGDTPIPRRMLEVNLCCEGSFRVLFAGQQSIMSILQGDLALAVTDVSDRARTLGWGSKADWVIDLPTSRYRGFGIIIDLELVASLSHDLIATLGMNFADMIESYRLEESPFVMSIDRGIEKTVDAIELHRKNGSVPLLRLGVLELLARIDAGVIPQKSLSRPVRSLESVRLTREARNHAVNHLCERYTISEISRRFGMSPTVFKSVFREIYGDAYARYMTRIRMERAEALLAEREPILSIAKAVGYESPSKFTAAFKRLFGESPSACRNRMRAEM